MLVSHKHRFVFIHNPKVGGTTFNDALTGFCENNYYRGRGIVNDRVLDLCHYRSDEWSKELVEAHENGYFFFGIVRNPYERFLSSISEHVHQHSDLIRGEDHYSYFVRALGHNSIRSDWRYIHFCPQHSFFSESKPASIYRLEDIWTWWDPLFEKIGVRAPALFNGRPSYFRPKELQPELIPLINDLYSEDFKKFNFPMTPVSEDQQKAYIEALPDYRRVELACQGKELYGHPTTKFVQAALEYTNSYGKPPQP